MGDVLLVDRNEERLACLRVHHHTLRHLHVDDAAILSAPFRFESQRRGAAAIAAIAVTAGTAAIGELKDFRELLASLIAPLRRHDQITQQPADGLLFFVAEDRAGTGAPEENGAIG